MIAISLWRLWDRTSPSRERTWTLSLFSAQLALNALWSPLFFGLHSINVALAIIVALDVVLAATIVLAWRIDRLAAWLLIPYLVWVAYATTLNAGIAALN